MGNNRKDYYGEQNGCRNCAHALKRLGSNGEVIYCDDGKIPRDGERLLEWFTAQHVESWGTCKKFKPNPVKSLKEKQKDKIVGMLATIAKVGLSEAQEPIDNQHVKRVVEKHVRVIWDIFKAACDEAERNEIDLGDRGEIINNAAGSLQAEQKARGY